MKTLLVKVFLPVLVVALVIVLAAIRMRSPREPAVATTAGDAVTHATTAWDAGAFTPLDAPRRILIHCGASMRPVAEAVATHFQRQTGIGVQFNFGGSAELLPIIEMGGKGDLYLCHDPYAAKLAEKGLLEQEVAVGYLEPTLIVPPGNPKAIKSLADLARPGLRVGLPDGRFNTCGKLVNEALAERGWNEQVRANVALETRGHNELAVAVLEGHLDVAVAWSFVPPFYESRLAAVSPGIAWPETRVTLCLLKTAADRAAAEEFIRIANSEHGRETFARHGYVKAVP